MLNNVPAGLQYGVAIGHAPFQPSHGITAQSSPMSGTVQYPEQNLSYAHALGGTTNAHASLAQNSPAQHASYGMSATSAVAPGVSANRQRSVL
ncbi:hypothetical protein CC2G_014316 [Coprinopsis cinerea AmutBmut pab1-1]|nr:hypothetical protein CC2G_014316 [Coprinopsis cinerea AmutBmut pab1-1]